jgi:archaellum component FlaG (FlaF/FlaG flagellin family)
VTFFTAIIAVAAAVQAICAYLIYGANKSMAEANEKSAEILRLQTQMSHRPGLIVRQVTLRSPELSLRDHADIAVHLFVVNTGAAECTVSQSNVTVLIDDARYAPYDRESVRIPYEPGQFRALPSAPPHPFAPAAQEEINRTIPGVED